MSEHRTFNTKGAHRRKIKKVVIWSGVIAVIFGVFVLIGGNSKPTSSQASNSGDTVGMMAPDFSLPATTDTTYTLSSYRGKKNVLIYFGEGLTCDPCMQQMPALDKELPQFNKLNIQLFDVAFDPVSDMKKAVQKYNLQTPVLSYNDSNTTVDKDYQLEENSMDMGRRAGHTFVLVGMNGKILWRKDYYQGRGMNGPKTNTMLVNGSEIVDAVKLALSGHASNSRTPSSSSSATNSNDMNSMSSSNMNMSGSMQ